MKIVGIMPCRGEDWVSGLSARAALMWCNELIMLDHGDEANGALHSVAAEWPERVTWIRASDPKWDEMEHRQRLLECARTRNATHIAIIDADEVLTGNLLGSIRGHVNAMRPGSILRLPGYNLRGSVDSYHSTGIWANRWFSVVFEDGPRLHWKGDIFHHREPMGVTLSPYSPVLQGRGGVMHLWGASERRLVAKHALYKMTETLRWPKKSRSEINQIYSQAINPAVNKNFDQNWKYVAVPAEWWEPYRDLIDKHLRVDAEPWQAEACRQLLAEHGVERFSGLNLWDFQN